MFNVTIIKLRDIVKITIILIIIYVSSKFVLKNISIKNHLSQSFKINTNEFIKFGINTESNIIKNISKTEKEEQTEEIEEREGDTFIKNMLQTGSSLFKVGKYTEKLIQSENMELVETSGTSIESESTQLTEAETNATTEVVTKNPIAENYNIEKNGVKIKNGTSYELTDEILDTNNLDINTKNVVIFHTHTCESYTQSENNKYTQSRKLSYNRFKLFCCKSWR